MNISDKGIALIKRFEGCRLTAYRCPANVLTIGYGHTAGVKEGQTITQAQAESYLKTDLAKYESNVMKYNDKYCWNQNEFDAMTSFAYNLGSINSLTANGSRSKNLVASKIELYNKANGKELAGLTTRRKAEKALFLTECTNTPSEPIKASESTNTSSDDRYKVKVTVSCLNIRAGSSTQSASLGGIWDRGVYTITETRGNWGRLLSGKGWICLDHTEKI